MKRAMLFLAIGLITEAIAQNSNPAPTLVTSLPASVRTIRLIVTCKEPELKSQIESFFKRELRALGDVEISESEAFFRIEIIAFSLQRLDGSIMHSAVASILVTHDFRSDVLSLMNELGISVTPETEKGSKPLQGLSYLVSSASWIDQVYLRTMPNSGLREEIQKAVAMIDNDVFAGFRSGRPIPANQ